MTTLGKHRRDWDDLANVDPYWAVLNDAERRYGRWDAAEFFATGTAEIGDLMGTAAELGLPSRRERALDFGCGLGRLTRALAEYFDECYGVDISTGMISQARELNRATANCHFLVNAQQQLPFEDRFFDLIYTSRVLQHMPSRAVIEGYLAELVRVLRIGGLLVFQLPTYIPLRHRLEPRRRLYGLLRSLGVSEQILYRRLRLTPMRMQTVPRGDIVAVLRRLGATPVRLEADDKAGPLVASTTYYVVRD